VRVKRKIKKPSLDEEPDGSSVLLGWRGDFHLFQLGSDLDVLIEEEKSAPVEFFGAAMQ